MLISSVKTHSTHKVVDDPKAKDRHLPFLLFLHKRHLLSSFSGPLRQLLGNFERVSESAAQYAERLLSGKKLPSPHTPQSLANHFVNHYKDHSFVIDTDEAISLLGKQMVKTESAECKAANEIYAFLDFMGIILNFVGDREYDYVGSIQTGLNIRKQRK